MASLNSKIERLSSAIDKFKKLSHVVKSEKLQEEIDILVNLLNTLESTEISLPDSTKEKILEDANNRIKNIAILMKSDLMKKVDEIDGVSSSSYSSSSDSSYSSSSDSSSSYSSSGDSRSSRSPNYSTSSDSGGSYSG